ncbi:MAG: hypothetical protein HY721_34970 [Planctomycetes bacterium]|nr:hypothetical protein [Planctomycetota bacterium]
MEQSAARALANLFTDVVNLTNFYYVKNLGTYGSASAFRAIARLGQIKTMSGFCELSGDRQTLTCPCLQGGRVVIDTESPLETFSGSFVHREGSFTATFEDCEVSGCAEECEGFQFNGQVTGSFTFDYDRNTGEQQALGSMACLDPAAGITASGGCGNVKTCPDVTYEGGVSPGGEPASNISGEVSAGSTNIQFSSLDDLIFKAACPECPPPIANLNGKTFKQLFTCVQTFTGQASPTTSCVDCKRSDEIRFVLKGRDGKGFVRYDVQDLPVEPGDPDAMSGELCGNRFTWVLEVAPRPAEGNPGYTETGTWYFDDPNSFHGFSTYFSKPGATFPFKGSCTQTGSSDGEPPDPTFILPCSPEEAACKGE